MNKKRKYISIKQVVGLMMLIGLLIGIHFFIHELPKGDSITIPTDSILPNDTPYHDLKTKKYSSDKYKPYPSDKHKHYKDSTQRSQLTIMVHMQPFDPNTADSTLLVSVGFRPWMASNILKYRSKKGQFRKPEDLKRIYGMTDSLYESLTPYIVITKTDSSSLPKIETTQELSRKSKPDTIIEINTADTLTLQYIKGIGSYRAKKIIQYRDQLGGFANASQVCETPMSNPPIWDSILPHLLVDTTKIHKLPIHTSGVRHLMNHPYISFTQAKEIYQLRREKTQLHTMSELLVLPSISTEDIDRLTPYIDFTTSAIE